MAQISDLEVFKLQVKICIVFNLQFWSNCIVNSHRAACSKQGCNMLLGQHIKFCCDPQLSSSCVNRVNVKLAIIEDKGYCNFHFWPFSCNVQPPGPPLANLQRKQDLKACCLQPDSVENSDSTCRAERVISSPGRKTFEGPPCVVTETMMISVCSLVSCN